MRFIMAHHKSAVKRNRQNRKRNLYNRANRRLLKDAVKSVRGSKTLEEARTALNKAISVLDKVASRGVIHKNTAANRKSSLARFVNRMAAAATA